MLEKEVVGVKGKIPPSKPGSGTSAQAKTWELVFNNKVEVNASKKFEKGAWILFVYKGLCLYTTYVIENAICFTYCKGQWCLLIYWLNLIQIISTVILKKTKKKDFSIYMQE